jgi:hypothetical protein
MAQTRWRSQDEAALRTHEDAEDWHEAQRLRAALLAAAGLDPD